MAFLKLPVIFEQNESIISLTIKLILLATEEDELQWVSMTRRTITIASWCSLKTTTTSIDSLFPSTDSQLN